MAGFKATRSIEIRGASSTGTQHTLSVEQSDDWLRFTIIGHNGKRHASVLLDTEYTSALLTDFLKEGQLT